MHTALPKVVRVAFFIVERKGILIGEDIIMHGQGETARPSEGEALKETDAPDQSFRLHEDLRFCLQGNHSGSSGMGAWSNHQSAFPPMHGRRSRHTTVPAASHGGNAS